MTIQGHSQSGGPEAHPVMAVFNVAQAGTQTFLQVAGADTREVVLWGNDVRVAQTPVELSVEVDQKTVRDHGSA